MCRGAKPWPERAPPGGRYCHSGVECPVTALGLSPNWGVTEGGRGTIWAWRCGWLRVSRRQYGDWRSQGRCGRPGLRGLITVRFRPPMDRAALRGHWIRWMATLTRRFMHRPTSGPAAPTGILFDTRLSRPFPRLYGPGKTGEDHTRVGCYEASSKVSRRGHLIVTSVRLYGSGSSIPT